MIYVDMVSRMFTYIESEETLTNIVQIKRYWITHHMAASESMREIYGYE